MSDERIHAACPECGAHLAAPPGAVGRRVRCPKCQHAFPIEAPAEAPHQSAAPALDDDLLSGLGSGTAVDTPEVRQARATAAAAAPPPPVFATPAVPQTAAPASGGFAWSAFVVTYGRFFLRRSWASRFSITAVVAGIALVAYGIHEFKLRSESSDVAQTMTCKEFQEAGSIRNRHIMLTNFALLPDLIYRERFGEMNGAWVPAIPLEVVPLRLAEEFRIPIEKLRTIPEEEKLAALRRFTSRDFHWKTLISFPEADGPEYIGKLAEVRTIEGMYMEQGIGGFDEDDQRTIERRYPNTDLSKLRILVAGRERTSMVGTAAYILGGIAAALGGLGYAARQAMYETVA